MTMPAAALPPRTFVPVGPAARNPAPRASACKCAQGAALCPTAANNASESTGRMGTRRSVNAYTQRACRPGQKAARKSRQLPESVGADRPKYSHTVQPFSRLVFYLPAMQMCAPLFFTNDIHIQLRFLHAGIHVSVVYTNVRSRR